MRTMYILLLVALTGFAVQSCGKSDASPISERNQPNQITAKEFSAKLAKADNSAPINYMRVNLEQLTAMITILDQNPSATSFKLYITDGAILVSGLDSTGQDIIIPKFSTGVSQSGPCPIYCDEQ